MVDLVANDGAEFRVGFLLGVAVADAAEIEVRTVADVALVFFRPLDDAEIVVCRFHMGKLVFCLRLGNRFCDLAFLVVFRIPVVGTAEGAVPLNAGCLNWRWDPFWRSMEKPAARRSLRRSRILRGMGLGQVVVVFRDRSVHAPLLSLGNHDLRSGLFVDLPGGGTQFLEEAIEKLEIATGVSSGVGFDGVFNGDEADEEFALRGGLVQVVPTGLPYVFGEVIDPLISFLFDVKGFGRAAFEVSHNTAKGGFDGGVGWMECRFSCFSVVGPDLVESPDGGFKRHYEVVEARVIHDDLLAHGGGGWVI